MIFHSLFPLFNVVFVVIKPSKFAIKSSLKKRKEIPLMVDENTLTKGRNECRKYIIIDFVRDYTL